MIGLTLGVSIISTTVSTNKRRFVVDTNRKGQFKGRLLTVTWLNVKMNHKFKIFAINKRLYQLRWSSPDYNCRICQWYLQILVQVLLNIEKHVAYRVWIKHRPIPISRPEGSGSIYRIACDGRYHHQLQTLHQHIYTHHPQAVNHHVY